MSADWKFEVRTPSWPGGVSATWSPHTPVREVLHGCRQVASYSEWLDLPSLHLRRDCAMSVTGLVRGGRMRFHAFLLLWLWPWPNDSDIWRWPRYSKDVTGHQKINFLDQGFQKLEIYSQTDRYTDRCDWMLIMMPHWRLVTTTHKVSLLWHLV